MKSVFVSILCGLGSGWLGAAGSASAQGTFLCGNVRLRNAAITDCSGTPVGGNNYVLEVRAQNPQTQAFDGGLERILSGEEKPMEPIRLLGGKHAGLFSVGTVRIPFVIPGKEAVVEFRAWDRTTGETFEQAKIRGSTTVKVTLGGVGQPASMPNPMTKFVGFKLCPSP